MYEYVLTLTNSLINYNLNLKNISIPISKKKKEKNNIAYLLTTQIICIIFCILFIKIIGYVTKENIIYSNVNSKIVTCF